MSARVGCSWGTRADGDFAVTGDAEPLAAMRSRVSRTIADHAGLPGERFGWVWLTQVHGDGVVVVGDASGEGAVESDVLCGREADALVTAAPGVVLAIHTADCAPVLLVGDRPLPDGSGGGPVVGMAHAGWRGLEAGVLSTTVEAMRSLGAHDIEARLGPCIHAECYEFGSSELDGLAERLGDQVRGVTGAGAPALDLPAAVWGEVGRLGLRRGVDVDRCTACLPETYFSHRARREAGRMANLAWIEP